MEDHIGALLESDLMPAEERDAMPSSNLRDTPLDGGDVDRRRILTFETEQKGLPGAVRTPGGRERTVELDTQRADIAE